MFSFAEVGFQDIRRKAFQPVKVTSVNNVSWSFLSKVSDKSMSVQCANLSVFLIALRKNKISTMASIVEGLLRNSFVYSFRRQTF